MSTLNLVLLAVTLGFVALMVGTQVAVRRRAAAMRGKPAPELPGAIGQALRAADRVLLYFYSPGCAACRPLTPRVRELPGQGRSVFLVNVAESLGEARAFGVMATPTLVEVAGGRVVGYHVGRPPADLLARFG